MMAATSSKHAVNPELLRHLSPEDLDFLNACVDADGVWSPHPNNAPQQNAYACDADILGYGGAAGGGKTDLGLGKALNKHQKIAIFRREGPQLLGIRNRLGSILGTDDGYNGKDNVWRDAGPRKVYIEFGSAPHAGDETKHQGRDKDLLIIEEAANFLASQVRFLMGWVRTTDPKQHCQTLLTFNPPTTSEGQWIVEFFAPWLDKKHPNPALPGELRWAASLPTSEKYPNGRDIWLDDGTPFVLVDDEPVFNFDPEMFDAEDIITPKTRTFISARVSDNPYLMGTGYMATLQSLPEPLRSQMLKGDFTAGMMDDPWQLCPTEWVEAAMARGEARLLEFAARGMPEMMALGADIARGGKDNTIFIPRYDKLFFGKPEVHPGTATPDGYKVAGLVVASARDDANINMDVIGVGASPYDILNNAKQPVFGIDVRLKSGATDKSGKLRMFNTRTELGWKFREMLDPANNTGIALYPDPRLKADLTAIKWSCDGITIQVELREETEKRIQRSPDWASAAFLAAIDNPKVPAFMESLGLPRDYDPYAQTRMLSQGRKSYDPYENV